MDRATKIWGTAASVLLIVGVLGIRFQSPIIIVTIFLSLIVTVYRPQIGLPATAVQFVLLYPGPNIGFLYGRDTLSLSAIARDIAINGWSLPQNVRFIWGDPSTPLIQFLIVIGSRLTDLGIFPRPNGVILFSTFIPLITVSITLLNVGLLIRRHVSVSAVPVAILPVLLWVPLFRFYTGVRRGTLSILFVSSLILIIYLFHSDRRITILSLPLLIAFPVAHHVGSAMALFVLLGIGLTVPQVRKLIIIAGGVVTVWFAWVTTRLVLAFSLAIGFIFSLSFGVTSVTELDQSIFDTVSFVTTNGVIVVLAVIFTAVLMWDWLHGGIKNFELGLYLYSIFVGGLTFAMFLGSGGLAHIRAATYFIIGASWLPIAKIRQLFKQKPKIRRNITAGLLALLILTAALNVEPHIISQQEPDFDSGETNQRFRPATFATGAWVDDHVVDTVVGDANTIEVVVPMSQQDGRMAGPKLANATVTTDSTVLINRRNNHLVTAKRGGVWYSIETDNQVQRQYQETWSRVYSNGWIDAYQQQG